jgi:signal transduction histidine kinase
VGAALVESLDYSTTLASVVRLAVPAFADWCFLDLVGEEGARRAEVAHADPAHTRLADDVKRFAVAAGGNWDGSLQVMEGASILIESVSAARIDRMAIDDEHRRILRRIAPRSVISVPLIARGRTLGVLTFIAAESGRRYDHADLAVAHELAKRCSLAMDNAALYRDAQEAIQLRDEFLSIASHELKTPLTPLQLQIHTFQRRLPKLVDNPESSAWIAERLRVLNRQAERLERLVQELLDISRIAGGRLTLEFEPVDLAELLREVVDRFEESGEIERSGSKVVTDIGSAVVGEWDRLRVEQIVTNIFTNALKYGEGKPIDLALTSDGSTATVSVTDRGLGIAREHLDRIFGRFERAVSARSYGGLGLGLYIAHQVAKAMGGSIAVRSSPGEGSTFTIHLPLHAPNAGASEDTTCT